MLDKISYSEIHARSKILHYYDVLINDDNEVLLCLNLKIPGEPKSPKFYYEGGKHGFLIKNERSIILCDYLHEGTHQIISQCDKVLFVETDDKKDILTEYEAEVILLEGIDQLGERLLCDDKLKEL